MSLVTMAYDEGSSGYNQYKPDDMRQTVKPNQTKPNLTRDGENRAEPLY